MRKPCKSCGGKKKSLLKRISKVLKLGATAQPTPIKAVEKHAVLTGDINSTPPRLSLPPTIQLKLKYHKIGSLKFPSNGKFFTKYKKDKDKKDKEKLPSKISS